MFGGIGELEDLRISTNSSDLYVILYNKTGKATNCANRAICRINSLRAITRCPIPSPAPRLSIAMMPTPKSS